MYFLKYIIYNTSKYLITNMLLLPIINKCLIIIIISYKFEIFSKKDKEKETVSMKYYNYFCYLSF